MTLLKKGVVGGNYGFDAKLVEKLAADKLETIGILRPQGNQILKELAIRKLLGLIFRL